MTTKILMGAPSLFDFPPARATDPTSSHLAAARIAPLSPTLRHSVLDALGRYGPMTKDACAQALAIEPRRWPTIASALSQLKNAGLLEWTGELVAGQNVWRLATRSVKADGEFL